VAGVAGAFTGVAAAGFTAAGPLEKKLERVVCCLIACDGASFPWLAPAFGAAFIA
jgi:hypothetical protein